MLNGFPITLSLNQPQNSLDDVLLCLRKHFIPPSDEVQSVNVVNILLPLVHFALNPVTVKIAENMVVVLSSSCIPLPFPDIIRKQSFICGAGRNIVDAVEMFREVLNQVDVKVLATKVCYQTVSIDIRGCELGDEGRDETSQHKVNGKTQRS